MNTKLVEDIAAAVLYEGYLLYPYRASAIKNRKRWNFGVLYPRAFAESQSGSSDAWRMQIECLIQATPEAVPTARVRFLHLIGEGAMPREMILQDVSLGDLAATPLRQGSVFRASEDQAPMTAMVELQAFLVQDGVYRLRLEISNAAQSSGLLREDALKQSLISTHAILGTDRGKFISLLDPPEELRETAAGCRNLGAWPVLAGEDGDRDAMLCSPIILYDYPKIAPESPGALFDGTEIDEILTLRILTMTEEEKREMAATDDRAREILERTEAMPPEQFLKLHGVLRGIREMP